MSRLRKMLQSVTARASETAFERYVFHGGVFLSESVSKLVNQLKKKIK